MAACTRTNAKGNPCRAAAINGTDHCISHSPKELQEAAGFGGPQPGAGRPRRPREIELVHEVAEECREALRAVFADGLTATRSIVVGNTKDAYVEEVPDPSHRLATAREIMDRLHGRPRQMTEVSGPDGSPVQIASTFDLSKLSVSEKRDLLELLEKANHGAS